MAARRSHSRRRAVARLAGLEVPENEIIRILKSLGFAVEGGDAMSVMPPSWRGDVEGRADLVEEVVRIYGLDRVPSQAMSRPHAVAQAVLTPAQKARAAGAARARRARLQRNDLQFLHRARAGRTVRWRRRCAADGKSRSPPTWMRCARACCRRLLAAAARNAARGVADQMLFEVGAQFESGMPGAQATVAAGIRVGAGARSWTKSTHPADAFDAKADMLAAIETAMGGAMTAPIKSGAPGWYHPAVPERSPWARRCWAIFGEVHPKILAAFDLKGPVAAFEVFLDAIPEPKTKGKARGPFAPSPYPAVERDFAFVVDAAVMAEDVVRAARNIDRVLIERVDVFDLYEGKGVPEGKKSLAIAVRLQPKDRTLTDAEIDAVAQKIVAAVTKATGGALRT